MLASAATATAAIRTTVTDRSYMARACVASSPASTMSAVNTSAPTTATPIARIASPTPADASAASAMRTAIPRPISDPPIRIQPCRAIADAPDGRHVARRLRVVVELVAEAADVDIDGPVQDLRLVRAVHGIEELVATEDASFGGQDRLEQSELDVGQRDRLAVAGHLVTVAIDGQVAVHDRGRIATPSVGVGTLRRRIDFTRSTSSAGENGFGR